MTQEGERIKLYEPSVDCGSSVYHERSDANGLVSLRGNQHEEFLVGAEVFEPECEPLEGALNVVGAARPEDLVEVRFKREELVVCAYEFDCYRVPFPFKATPSEAARHVTTDGDWHAADYFLRRSFHRWNLMPRIFMYEISFVSTQPPLLWALRDGRFSRAAMPYAFVAPIF